MLIAATIRHTHSSSPTSLDSRWLFPCPSPLIPRVKSFLSLTFVLLVFLVIVVGGGLLWYLSDTTEFSRKDTPPSRPAAPAPAATPALPPTPAPSRL